MLLNNNSVIANLILILYAHVIPTSTTLISTCNTNMLLLFYVNVTKHADFYYAHVTHTGCYTSTHR